MGRGIKNKLDQVLTNINKSGDCWLWQGPLDQKGYGNISFAGKTWRTHRLFYTRYKGLIPLGLEICHSCDHPACVNPSHLWLGTHEDNMTDMANKGRAKAPDHHGENNNLSKLTEIQVADIRERYKGRGIGPSQQKLADEFGLHQSTISYIISHRNWNGAHA